ncbi:MAG: DNA internalization-related competence protein ComEC/Rec2 [Psychromonas sp.]|nr:DNA internalization-related competence protein ComEC/Rec2 [Psychromonas sp.]
MRILLWLIIAVFISTLFWPELLNNKSIVLCVFLGAALFLLPRLRFLAVVPIAAVYFTLYANLTLTGSLPIAVLSNSLPFINTTSLQVFADGHQHNAIVQVNSLINQKNNGYFTARLIEIDGNRLNYSPLLEMRWYKPTVSVQEGQRHRFMLRLKPVYGRANPAGFDRQKWRFSEHIAYQANIQVHLSEVSERSTFRASFYQKVQALSASLNNQGIILALSFADKTLMSPDKKELIKKLAISHLFAISGLHIGLFFSFAYLLLTLLVSYFFPKRYLGWGSWRFINFMALLAAFFYAYLAGFSLPTQRALFMLLLAVLVLSMKRKCALSDLLTLTLFIILLWDPLAVLSVSLWLSFAAIAIILSVLWRFSNIIEGRNHSQMLGQASIIKGYFKFLFLIQFSLTFLMMPMQLLHFSAFNWLSLPINFIAVPFFSLLIIPVVLLGCLFALFIPFLAVFLFSSADHLISLFFTVFAGTETAYHFYSVAYSQIIILLISLSVLLFMLYFQAPHNRQTSFVFAGLVLILTAVSFWERNSKAAEAWFVEALDVGQGLAVLVRSQGQTLLYDSGPRYPSGFNTATTEIVPYLQALGVTRLDYLVVSHSDTDHAGGVDVIMADFTPRQVILGEPLQHHKKKLFNSVFCNAGQKWSLGALSVTVLSPFILSKNNNNNSCVLRITDSEHSLLLTGDIEQKQEMILLQKEAGALASDLLVAPHHGSRHSSSAAFIKAISPQWVIFTAGFMNRWHFPADEVKLRYKNQSVKMVNSGISGFVRFKIAKEQIKMQTYREDFAAYWYHHAFDTQTISTNRD